MLDIEITDDDINTIEEELSLEFDEKRRAVLKDNTSIDVQACPGSGKTTLLGCKLLLLAKKWKDIDRGVCVLSHTNVAKDEILKVLQKHPAGYKFTKYPHFVGTIQDFVDCFLALPEIRSTLGEIRVIDSEFAFNYILHKLNPNTKSYLERTKITFNEENFRIKSINGKDIEFHIPSFKKESTSQSYLDMKEKRLKAFKKGIFTYRDMYFLGKNLIDKFPIVQSFLAQRFPLVFIDEMQDTQQFQDDLLCSIFKAKSIMQRFGDPDQAIFSNSNNMEQPNKTYNSKQTGDFSYEINNSNRFNNSCKFIEFFKVRKNEENPLVATKFRSSQEEQFLSRLGKSTEFKHHIILYNTPSCQVLEKYGEIILEEYGHLDENLIHKAVGIVGREKEGEGDLTIKHYWNDFDKNKTNLKFKPTHFMDVIKLCKTSKENCYNYFIDACIMLLRNNGQTISKNSFIEKLKETNKKDALYQIFYGCMVNSYPNTSEWDEIKQNLLSILDTEDNDFLSYDEFSQTDVNRYNAELNTYKCSNGVKIKIETIHSVKGETHDSTLVLETKYYKYDLSYFFTNPGKPSYSKLKKELDYVAVSRPRHLLCLAIQKSELGEDIKSELQEIGWVIDEID